MLDDVCEVSGMEGVAIIHPAPLPAAQPQHQMHRGLIGDAVVLKLLLRFELLSRVDEPLLVGRTFELIQRVHASGVAMLEPGRITPPTYLSTVCAPRLMRSACATAR